MADFTWNDLLDIAAGVGDFLGIGNSIRKLAGDKENTKALNEAEAKLRVALQKLQKHDQAKYDQIVMSMPKLRNHLALNAKDRAKVSHKANQVMNENANLEKRIEAKLSDMSNDRYGDYSDRVKYSPTERNTSVPEMNRLMEKASLNTLLGEVEERTKQR